MTLALSAAACGSSETARSQAPPNDDFVVAALPGDRQDAARSRLVRQRFRRAPADPTLAAAVAGQYIAKGKETGDVRYYGHAQAVLRPWFDLEQAPLPVLAQRLKIRQFGHDFRGAVADTLQLLNQDSGNNDARFNGALMLQTLGRYDEALELCRGLASSLPQLFELCSIHVSMVRGEARAGYRRLRELDADLRARPALRAWAGTMAAEAADRLDEIQAARESFQTALTLAPGDRYTVLAFADHSLRRGQPAVAYELTKGDRQNDGYLLRVALARKQLDPHNVSSDISELARRYEANLARGDNPHYRDEIRFHLWLRPDPKRALELALQSWKGSKDPQDAELLAAAAVAEHDESALDIVRRFRAETHLEDAELDTVLEAGVR